MHPRWREIAANVVREAEERVKSALPFDFRMAFEDVIAVALRAAAREKAPASMLTDKYEGEININQEFDWLKGKPEGCRVKVVSWNERPSDGVVYGLIEVAPRPMTTPFYVNEAAFRESATPIEPKPGEQS